MSRAMYLDTVEANNVVGTLQLGQQVQLWGKAQQLYRVLALCQGEGAVIVQVIVARVAVI